MKLSALLHGTDCVPDVHMPDREIGGITCDSRAVAESSLFFCLRGEKADGHDYAAKVLENGAAAVVCERDMGLGERQIMTGDSHLAYAKACANYHGNPADKLKLIGVTGTNGKTTTAFIVKSMLESAGKKAGLIGTVRNEIGDMVIPAKYTTPEPFGLQAIFARMAGAGCEYVVMEVSSHALEQERVAGCRFVGAAFTNLTQDHLDYHGTMESYFDAKKKLFTLCDNAVLNFDDPWTMKLVGALDCPTLSFSCESDAADLIARDIKYSAQGCRFSLLWGSRLARVKLAMPGKFSVCNALAAAGLCAAAGLSFEEIVKGLSESQGVVGRIEVLPTDTDFTVIRDYAHSPDGLLKVLEALREFATGRIVTLFGCAGNRDRTKRPLMAEIAARLSDYCILTSDNPRDEDPQRIIDDAMPGFAEHKTPHKEFVDRYEAIEWALGYCREGDILLLAGKGHEDYQVLSFGTVHFDEKEVVAQILKNKREKKSKKK